MHGYKIVDEGVWDLVILLVEVTHYFPQKWYKLILQQYKIYVCIFISFMFYLEKYKKNWEKRNI